MSYKSKYVFSELLADFANFIQSIKLSPKVLNIIAQGICFFRCPGGIKPKRLKNPNGIPYNNVGCHHHQIYK